MANQARTFQDGINEINGYTVNVIRFTSAFTTGYNSITGRPNRQCALHWGTITTPDGREISMGDKGMSTPQIKSIIGVKPNNTELSNLIKARNVLESNGMSTDEIDAKIEAKKAEIEAERNRVDNSAEIKKLEKEIKKIEEAREILTSNGVSTDELDNKLSELKSQVEALR
jgi:galactitol-specific phosphotransferase system IIB component